ncbi:MAG TPA: FAD-binding oxidoreductase [Gemmatimonadaceae bacterium]|nr:FAD-binding oxidoreductase [Gemmatimonadaceae bacterium]
MRDDLPARAVYAEGAGIARAIPRGVAVCADADDASALVRWARETRTPLVPRGSGSGMAGGAVGQGTIVDLSRLTHVEPVDTARGRVHAQAGAVRDDVDRAARAHGLRLPVDPSSGAFCTVGGMASTNAAGARTLRYGSTRAWVEALDCVFDDGTRATVRRGAAPPATVPAIARFLREADRLRAAERAAPSTPPVRKCSSGYALAEWARSGELVDLLVGSEGTLALFVAVELSLAPVPGATSTLLAAFPSLEAAVEGAARAREQGAAACELLDRTFLEFVAERSPLAVREGSEAVLIAEVEGDSRRDAAAAATALGDAVGAVGGAVTLALDVATERAIWALRHAASPLLATLDPALRSMQFIEDACVPPERLPAYVRGVRTALARQDMRGVIFGHAGDGNVHVNPLVDLSRPDWRERVQRVLDEVTALVATLDGTLSGEHGDGRLRTPLLERVWDGRPADALARFALVKRAFDPEGIFNPGVKVSLRGQEPLGEIRYDPALPPLPAAARTALSHIERVRAWNAFRLDALAAAERELAAADRDAEADGA